MKINVFKLLVIICFVFLVAIVFTLPGFADNGTIRVKCVDSSSNPVAGAVVTVISLGNSKVKPKKSDSKGMAEFITLDDGGYRIVARQDGFEPALNEFVVLKGSHPTESVTLTLVAGSDKELYFENPELGKKTADLLNQAINLNKENKFEEAEKLLNQAIAMDPSNPQGFRILGVTLLQASKFEESEAAFKKAAKILSILTAAPQQTQAQQLSDQVQQILRQIPGFKGENDLRGKNFDQAIDAFTQVLKNDPNNPEWHADMAIALANSQKIDEALSFMDKAIQLKPGEKKYEELKNQISAMKGQAEYLKMKALQDDANKLSASGDAAGALKKYEELKSLAPQDKQGPVLREIGRLQVKLNQPDAAVQSFKKAIELAPDEKAASDSRSSLAQFYLDQKKYDDAVNVLAESKSADPQNTEQTLLAIFAKFKDADSQFAESVLERIIKINPQNADAYFDLGQMYFAEGKEKYGRAKELLAKYTEIGKDQDKIKRANDFLVSINWSNSAKSKSKSK
jgi:Flp pilus assembly protein TadD